MKEDFPYLSDLEKILLDFANSQDTSLRYSKPLKQPFSNFALTIAKALRKAPPEIELLSFHDFTEENEALTCAIFTKKESQ